MADLVLWRCRRKAKPPAKASTKSWEAAQHVPKLPASSSASCRPRAALVLRYASACLGQRPACRQEKIRHRTTRQGNEKPIYGRGLWGCCWAWSWLKWHLAQVCWHAAGQASGSMHAAALRCLQQSKARVGKHRLSRSDTIAIGIAACVLCQPAVAYTIDSNPYTSSLNAPQKYATLQLLWSLGGSVGYA